jgi:hypothetical protein
MSNLASIRNVTVSLEFSHYSKKNNFFLTQVATRVCKAPYQPGNDGVLRCPKCLATNKEAHSGNVLLEVFLMESDEIRKTINERRDILSDAVINRVAPPREEGLCNYCSHEQECFNTAETL